MRRFASGLILAAAAAAPAAAAWAAGPDERRSGYEYMHPETRAMQDDDASNPAMLWVIEGEQLWNRKDGAAGKACADCHADMKGVAARYPRLVGGRPMNLEQRINACRIGQQRAAPLEYESRELLALEAYVGTQSRGLPIVPDERARVFAEKGRALFLTRMGQVNLSCSQCHDQNAGRHLGGSVIPQAHPTGYPLYRLEWESLGSLQRRLRSCMANVRAEPYAYGSEELVDLELFLKRRARGMKIETPAVRP